MYDVVIIGAGVAGISASIYAKRSNMNVLLVEKDAPGGQINKTAEIENYPGFTSIKGPDLAFNLFNQITALKIPYKSLEVLEIIDNKDYKILKTSKEDIKTKSVIIATGRSPRKLGIENEDKLYGNGISFCAICDANLYKDKDVLVVGGGNSALEESLYLSNIASSVTIINRSNKLRADNKVQDIVKQKENIEIVYNTEIDSFNIDKEKLVSVNLKNKEDRSISELETDGIFIFIGYEPSNNLIMNLDLINDEGYIIVNNKMETKIPGIFACGDIIKKDLYQIVTSESEGAIAATFAKKYVDSLDNEL